VLKFESSDPIPTDAVRLALIGAGDRMRNVFAPLFESVTPWLRVVAVCNRGTARRTALADSLGVPAFADVRGLIRAGVCEAALVVTPPALNHPLSVTLSTAGVHHMTETPWSVTAWQAREMFQTARRHGVVARVAENFFRFARDRFALCVRDSGVIGPIHRIVCYGSIIGFHTSARWLRFAGAPPQWVQSVQHTTPTAAHRPVPTACCATETYQGRHLLFPGNLLVADSCANRKGYLGRYPRDGYTAWQGERGTLVDAAEEPKARWAYAEAQPVECDSPCPTFTPGRMVLRRCGDASSGPPSDAPEVSAAHDEQSPVIHERVADQWTRSYAHTGHGLIEYVNPLRPGHALPGPPPEYAVSIMGELIDFALAVRGLGSPEFDDQDALDTMMIEAAARESALRDGQRVSLPLEETLESDAILDGQLREYFGFDPRDIEAVVSSMAGPENQGKPGD